MSRRLNIAFPSRAIVVAVATALVLALITALSPAAAAQAGAATATTTAGAAGTAAQLKDVPGHWAEEAITTLLRMGVVQGYPDGAFKPENPITRAEFSKMVALAFGYPPSASSDFPDVAGTWAEPYVAGLGRSQILTGYPDGSFKPSKGVTRAEAAAILARVAGLTVIKPDMASGWTPSYRDVDESHWAYVPVEIARRLDVAPLHFGLMFEPDRAATRAETAYMVRTMAEAQFARGQVTSVNKGDATVTIKNVAGNTQVLQLSPDAVVFRNGAGADVESLRTNDQVYAVGDPWGQSRFVLAEGAITKEDITKKISALTDGIVTPEQVDALSRGKWDEARAGMSPALADRLVEMGLTDEEAEALLAQDWERLPALGQTRLAEALAAELGVAPELVEALMARDWAAARNLAELEAAEMLLSYFLQMR